MFTKKEWLVSEGHLPPGSENQRGRVSVAHEKLCEEAAARGIQIKGYAVKESPTPNSTPTVEKVKTSTVIEPATYTYPEGQYRVFERVDGRKKFRSMRCACGNCSVSLVGHWCDEPKIVATDGRGWVRVFIEPDPTFKEGND